MARNLPFVSSRFLSSSEKEEKKKKEEKDKDTSEKETERNTYSNEMCIRIIYIEEKIGTEQDLFVACTFPAED